MRFALYLLTFLSFSAPVCAFEAEIRFATDWRAQAEHGGFYQALAAGHYRSVGLDVLIRPGGPQVDIPRLMAAGALDIAMASNSFQPFNMKAAGADVTIVMAVFQKDPQVLMLHPDNSATSLDELKGTSIFIADSAVVTFWPWLKARFGYQDRQIRKYTYSLAPWLVNKKTALEGYVSSEPYAAQKAGIDPKVFLFADAGYPGYATMVMVRNEYLKDNEDTVRAFVRASIKGWQDFLYGNASVADALILKDNPEMTQAQIDFSRRVMLARDMAGEKSQIGLMCRNRWSSFYSEMVDLNVLKAGLDPDSIWTNRLIGGTRADCAN